MDRHRIYFPKPRLLRKEEVVLGKRARIFRVHVKETKFAFRNPHVLLISSGPIARRNLIFVDRRLTVFIWFRTREKMAQPMLELPQKLSSTSPKKESRRKRHCNSTATCMVHILTALGIEIKVDSSRFHYDVHFATGIPHSIPQPALFHQAFYARAVPAPSSSISVRAQDIPPITVSVELISSLCRKCGFLRAALSPGFNDARYLALLAGPS